MIINLNLLILKWFFRFAQDIFNKIFSTLGNINKFLFLSLIEKIAFRSAIRVNSILSPKAQRPLVALAYSQIFRFAQDIAFRSA